MQPKDALKDSRQDELNCLLELGNVLGQFCDETFVRTLDVDDSGDTEQFETYAPKLSAVRRHQEQEVADDGGNEVKYEVGLEVCNSRVSKRERHLHIPLHRQKVENEV